MVRVVLASDPTVVLAAFPKRAQAEAERDHLVEIHGYAADELEIREGDEEDG